MNVKGSSRTELHMLSTNYHRAMPTAANFPHFDYTVWQIPHHPKITIKLSSPHQYFLKSDGYHIQTDRQTDRLIGT
jgi:hypothetical protein